LPEAGPHPAIIVSHPDRVGLSNVVAIAAGDSDCLALKSDGTVVGWGQNFAGQANIPAGISGIIAISQGVGHNLALKSDGTVAAWGDNEAQQCSVPAGLSNVIACII
jgi:alpha-tubulin suppressor-like RCC1 family protein